MTSIKLSKKNNSLLNILIAVFVIMLLIFLYFDYVNIVPVMNQGFGSPRVTRYISIDVEPMEEFVLDTQISQSFFYEGYIRGFSVRFLTYDRENVGTVLAELYVDQRQVFFEEVQFSDIENNAFHFFDLGGRSFDITYNDEAKIVLTSLEGEYGSSIAVLVATNDIDQAYGDLQFFIHGFYDYNPNAFIRPVFWGFAALWMAGILWVIFLLKNRVIAIEKVFLILACMIGFTYLFLLPPMSTPDELTHIRTAYGYSNILSGNQINSVRVADRIEIRGLGFNAHPRLTDYRRLHSSLFNFADREIVESNINLHNEPPYLYLFSALGVSIARIFGMSSTLMLILGGMFNLTFYVASVYLSIKIIPFGKMIIFTIALFPLSIQQAASFSSDTVIFGLAFLTIAYVLYLAYDKEKVTLGDLSLLGLLLVLLIPTKGGVNLPFAFVCLLIPMKKVHLGDKIQGLIKFEKRHLKYLLFSFIGLGFIISFIFLVDSRLVRFMTEATPGFAGNTHTISFVFENLLRFALIFINTLVRHGTFYLLSAVGSSLGWLEISVRQILIIGFIFVAFLATLNIEKELMLFLKHKIVILFIVLVNFSLILLALFIIWTPTGAIVIEGVQGRYFIPILPLFLLLFSNSTIVLKRNINNALVITLFFLQLFTVLNVFEVIIWR